MGPAATEIVDVQFRHYLLNKRARMPFRFSAGLSGGGGVRFFAQCGDWKKFGT